MTVTTDGYSIHHDVKHNQITIGLPQTLKTATNTTWPVRERREEITEKEEIFILNYVRALFELDPSLSVRR